MSEVTRTTKLPRNETLARFLAADAGLMNEIARQFYVDWQVRGGDPDELIKEYQSRFGITWHQANSIHPWVKGMADSLHQSQQRQIADIQGQLKSAQAAVKKWEKLILAAVKKLRRKKNPVVPEARSQQQLRLKIHYKRRRIAQLQSKLEKLKTNPPRRIFGGKKLWKAQFNLKANEYNSFAEWKEEWNSRRTSQFVCIGKALDRQGNRSVRLFSDGTLRISVPPALRVEFGEFVEVTGVAFPYGQNDIEATLFARKALTHRFVYKDGTWYLHTTVERIPFAIKTHRSKGMMGIDLNPKEVGWAVTDVQGNLVKAGTVRYDIQGKTSNQAEQSLALVVKEVVLIALHYEVPITVEKLDFTEKKRSLRELGKRYSKMLSAFAYSKFEQLLTSRCEREGVKLLHKNAVWSSLIGMAKFMKRYGLSSATAAALVMARRGQGHSERLPARYARLLQVDGNRHVWNHWGTFKKKLVLDMPRHGFFDLSALEQAFEGKPTGSESASQ